MNLRLSYEYYPVSTYRKAIRVPGVSRPGQHARSPVLCPGASEIVLYTECLHSIASAELMGFQQTLFAYVLRAYLRLSASFSLGFQSVNKHRAEMITSRLGACVMPTSAAIR